ncbi:MAG: protein translocase subunit SecD [Erysipelotrichaceae bacterium]|nr:protein translocase subunit SecD [Erysipelotrichaceae bacterium]
MKNKTNSKRLATFFITVIVLAALVLSTYKNIANNLSLGLDLQGGFEILYEVEPLNENDQLDMSAVSQSVSKRVDVLGVSEPQIIIEGDNRIRVQLAGVTNPEDARKMISTTANLTFRDINDNLLADASIIEEGKASLAYENGQPVVSLKIKDATAFGDITEKVANMGTGNNIMVIWLDYEEGDSYLAELAKVQQGQEAKYISAASVNERISGDCVIKGSFTDEEARTLANLINSGSLPVKMTEISSNVVSAEFGIDAFNKTVVAGAVGIALVILFMLLMYRLPGLVASIMLVVYIWVIFGIYNLIGAVFTLPGIAALVLGVGMTVDANIITFERIKDELYQGRSIQKACEEGMKTSFITIFDAQFTTLLAGLIMYVLGNGTVKGFATMLIITVVATLLLNVALSHFLLKQLVYSGICDGKYSWFNVNKKNVPDISKKQEQFYFGPIKKNDYVKQSSKFNFVSLAIIVVAIVMMVFNGVNGNGPVNLGIDFSSGTKITVTSNEPITIAEVQEEFEKLGYTSGMNYQASGDNNVYVTTTKSIDTESLAKIKDVFNEKYGIEPNDNIVTPTVGKELVKNAITLSIIAWLAMLLYITIRFKWDYALGCIVALLHDVLIVVSFFAIFRFEFNTELISVILAIIGYSINNSIVVFDRVRSNVSEYDGKFNANSYKVIVNDALDNTIIRSIFSSITTIMPMVALLILGSHSIFTFTCAMIVGLLAGTYSSIYLAPYVWYLLRCNVKPKAKKPGKKYKEDVDEYTIKGINA